MLFSSTVFIFIFLPTVLFLYYIIPQRHIEIKNTMLLFFSLVFYAWGEPKFVLIMVASIVGNYIFGRLIEEKKSKRIYLGLGVAFNLTIIIIFKYLNFIIENINNVLDLLEIDFLTINQTKIVLPIGISFFTFQAISYLIDVYRKDVPVQRNPFYLGLYISFFPQLIAGPIVRYADINVALKNRKETFEKFNLGTKRFIFGLSKKVIIANNMALIADQAFMNSSAGGNTVLMAWLGALAYTLQIYFDFSGYSDMAIGLGKMFGFDFNENFNYPYISKSVGEFWRRWHISLGTWFKDYVYVPLGGSRTKTRGILVRNLFIVWLLTGIWHGASWNFIFWGILYFLIITVEKLTGYPEKFKSKNSKIIYQIFTMLCVVLGWVLFRSEGLSEAVEYIMSMFGIGVKALSDNTFIEFFMEYKFFMAIGILLSTPIISVLRKKINLKNNYTVDIIETFVCGVLLIVSISYLVLESYNPFIYFNF